MSSDTMVELSAVVIAVCLAIFLVAVAWRIESLERRVSCLEHPHGESSLTAVRLHGRWVASVPRTSGCTP